ncbi:uncharacterized protein Z520_06979 [Fonsecaea multimorphosa CBS 102226]|uniref:Uncharacterized protein n=1 Tax=Fonsecaea multimorphosa CBS 102226 TaxID=1442371 RepID=A0A0D2JVN5_9EURO|nr:uncharacterized protein Z520_06979 [Fonsecaea multimorphosa CBS 102226]KIX97527.1 hypothetical protein Z520_06979 [Fonsecaea multimorphosa CBS 102226]OAL23488.1 hypothetical protein AYO22_06538 [Fonsecaea multimorphosa]
MDDLLLDALTPVLSIPRLPAALSALISRPPAARREDHDRRREQLSSHADAFRRSLGRNRPRYEDDEEREKLGGLRQCAWTCLDKGVVDGDEDDQRSELRIGKKGKRKRAGGDDYDDDDGGRAQLRGLAVSLVYEKDTFRFVIYTSAPRSDRSMKRKRTAATRYQRTAAESREESAILLPKSSPAALKSFTDYLRDAFDVTAIYPLELPSSLMQSTLEQYLETIRASLFEAAGGGSSSSSSAQALLQQNFSTIIGKIELTIAFSQPVSKGLKSMHAAIPATAYLAWYKSPAEKTSSRGDNRRGQRKTAFLGSLAGWIRGMSGLCLPILNEKEPLIPESDNDRDDSDNNDDDDNSLNTTDTPSNKDAQLGPMAMKISRISNEAYTISATSGLKFKSRAVHAFDDIISADPDRGEEGKENCVRRANQELLLALIDYVRREAGQG